MQDPKIHSHIEDVLPNEHPLSHKCVLCSTCGGMLHASNNECMQTWIETGNGNFCVRCFAKIKGVSALGDEYGLMPNAEVTGRTTGIDA